jgi:hypothetical protein
MGPESRLLIVEALLPERARDQPAVIRMDLHMLVLLGAHERTGPSTAGCSARPASGSRAWSPPPHRPA